MFLHVPVCVPVNTRTLHLIQPAVAAVVIIALNVVTALRDPSDPGLFQKLSEGVLVLVAHPSLFICTTATTHLTSLQPR